MGDPWFEMNERIDSKVQHLKDEADKMGNQLREDLKQAKESAIFEVINKLETKVDAIAARLPDREET